MPAIQKLRIEPISHSSLFVEIDGLTLRIESHNNSISVIPVNEEGEKIELKKTRIIQGDSWEKEKQLPNPKITTDMEKVSEVIFGYRGRI